MNATITKLQEYLDNTIAKLRPSALPKLNACIHWESTGESSVYSDRGNVIDDLVDKILSGKETENTSEEYKAAEWVANKARELLKDEKDV